MRHILRYTKGRHWALGMAFVLGMVSNALDLATPLALKWLLDQFSGPIPPPRIFFWPALGVVSAVLVSALLLYWQRYLIISRSRDVEMELRNDLFQDLQNQPKVFFDTHPVGDLMSRISNDVEKVRELLGPGFLHLSRMGFGLVYAAIAMTALSPRLTAVGLGTSLLLPLASLYFRKTLHASYKRTSEKLSAMSVLVQETLGGIHVIKSLGRENWFSARFAAASEDFASESTLVARQTSLVWPMINLISGASLCATLAYGAWMVASDAIGVGTLAAITLFLVRVQFPLVGLGWVATMLQRGFASLDRIVELRRQFVEAAPQGTSRDRFESVILENVSFQYGGNDGETLQHIDLHVRPGSNIGIVGETGSGKSTLLHLLAGIEQPSQGSIRLDGQAITAENRDSYTSLFALAPQDGFLFSESITENIALGQQKRTRLSVDQASRIACLHHDLQNLPDGLNTMLGEKGINLSGGQKQRVGLARALLSEAPILLLDDTLSAVDGITEREIIAELQRGPSAQACVIVSHRYTAVVHCDEILVLQKGRIVERGTHLELLARKGLYAATWEQQQNHD